MRKQRLGCLTPISIIAATITLAAIAGSFMGWGGMLFSPGDLSARASNQTMGGVNSHFETKGYCAACHTAPWSRESMAMRCVSCHSKIEDQLAEAQNLHGSVMDMNNKIVCRDCHTDHQGGDALITFMSSTPFSHDVLGYSLEGHQTMPSGALFDCSGCHGEDVTSFTLAVCETCHSKLDGAYMQTHLETFGEACLACHDGIDTYGDFDHNKADFPLVGEHATLECGECHKFSNDLFDLQATLQACYDCHGSEDAHSGELGQTCEKCHTPKGWDQINVDHSLTAFPLTGEHIEVACEECHIDGVFSGTPTDCASCHIANDIHNGQFGTGCASCHITDGWQFNTFDHVQANATNCAACHLPDRPANHFGGQCSACHNTTTWAGAV
ncbi:MAG: cytochrome c3 family protein, partial [Anaerolineae bacterium]|nr:cytochrome c3 family protein [Anaerolineae bacterium]